MVWEDSRTGGLSGHRGRRVRLVAASEQPADLGDRHRCGDGRGGELASRRRPQGTTRKAPGLSLARRQEATSRHSTGVPIAPSLR